jgi:hypothetical protein
MEKKMKYRTRLRTLPKGTPELAFAGMVAFLFLLFMLIRAIDMMIPVQ